jgi:hypothetical protein
MVCKLIDKLICVILRLRICVFQKLDRIQVVQFRPMVRLDVFVDFEFSEGSHREMEVSSY